MGKSCSKIILLILILAAWIVVTVRAKKTEEGIILTDAYKKQIMESAEWKKIFLHTENYPDILLEDLKRNPEMLEFVEGYNDVHKKSSEGLTFEEQKKKVPLFIQWNSKMHLHLQQSWDMRRLIRLLISKDWMQEEKWQFSHLWHLIPELFLTMFILKELPRLQQKISNMPKKWAVT